MQTPRVYQLPTERSKTILRIKSRFPSKCERANLLRMPRGTPMSYLQLKDNQIMEETKPRIASKTYQGVFGLAALSSEDVSHPISELLQTIGLPYQYSWIILTLDKLALAAYALYGREHASGVKLSGILQTPTNQTPQGD